MVYERFDWKGLNEKPKPKTFDFSDGQRKKIKSSCTCNFKLVEEPETKMIDVTGF